MKLNKLVSQYRTHSFSLTVTDCMVTSAAFYMQFNILLRHGVLFHLWHTALASNSAPPPLPRPHTHIHFTRHVRGICTYSNDFAPRTHTCTLSRYGQNDARVRCVQKHQCGNVSTPEALAKIVERAHSRTSREGCARDEERSSEVRDRQGLTALACGACSTIVVHSAIVTFDVLPRAPHTRTHTHTHTHTTHFSCDTITTQIDNMHSGAFGDNHHTCQESLELFAMLRALRTSGDGGRRPDTRGSVKSDVNSDASWHPRDLYN
jgi:hypothetical protein